MNQPRQRGSGAGQAAGAGEAAGAGQDAGRAAGSSGGPEPDAVAGHDDDAGGRR